MAKSFILFLIILSNNLFATTNNIGLSDAEKVWISEHKVIRAGITTDWPPYEYIDSAGNYSGYTAEYLNFLLTQLGISLKIDSPYIAWPEALEMVKKHELDIAPAVFITEARRKYLKFTTAYTTVPHVIITRSDNHTIKSFSELQNKTVSCMRGWAAQISMSKDHPHIRLSKCDRIETLIGEVMMNKTDAGLIDMGTLAYISKHHNISNLKVAFETPYTYQLSFGIRDDWRVLVNILNKTIRHYETRELSQIKDKWLGFPKETNSKLVSQIITILIVVMALALLAFIWIFQLKLEIRKRTKSLEEEIKTSQQWAEALRESELRYKTLFDSAYDAILIIENGRFIECNSRACQLFGLPKDTIISHSPNELSPEYQPDGELSTIKGNHILNMARSGNLLTFEWRHYRYPLSTFDAEISLNAFEVGSKEFLTVIMRDISERKQIEQELKQHRENLEDLVKLKTIDLETLNKKLQKSNNELTALNSELDTLNQSLSKEIQQKSIIQNKLEINEEKYRSFIQQSGLGIMLYNAEGYLLEMNKTMEEYIGIDILDYSNLHVWDIEFLMNAAENRTTNKYEKLKAIKLDYLNRLPDAPVVTIETTIDSMNPVKYITSTVFPIITRTGVIVGQVARDITEQKNNDIELEQYRTLLEELIIKRTTETQSINQRYKEIISNTSDAIFFIDIIEPDIFKYVGFNPVTERILGITNKQLGEGKLLHELFPEPIANTLKSNYKLCLKNEEPTEYIEHVDYQNKKITFKTLLIPIRNNDGKIYRIAGFSRDITAEQLIREEQEFNSILFNTVQNLIMVLDTNGRIIRFNHMCEKISGHNSDEVYEKIYWEVLFPEDKRNEIERLFQELKTADSPLSSQTIWYSKDFEPRNILWTYSWLKNKDNHNQYLVASGIDLTERLKMEDALRESETKFRTIFNSSTDGIAITGLDRYFIEVNPTITNKLGYSKDEIRQLKSFEILSPRYHNEINKRFLDLLKENELGNIELEAVTKTGELIPIEINGKVIDFEGQKAILTFIRDITERKQLENQLMEVVLETEEKERRHLSSDLHDEIGPLLASLRMYTSTLSRKLANSEHSNVLTIIQRLIKDAVEKTREISNNLSPHLLDAYGIEAAIRAEIENTLLILPVKLQSNISEIRFEKKTEIVIYRILKELLNNTRKYAEATEANINMHLKDNVFKLIYSDNGRGFDYNILSQNISQGMGILNIKNRARSINADYQIISSYGKGFYFELECQIKLINLSQSNSI